MTKEPEWHDGQDVPDGWAVIARLGRLWTEVPEHERATQDDWIHWLGEIPGRGEHLHREYLRPTVSAPLCEIAVSTDNNPAWRDGLWLPCLGEVHDNGRRCPRHGGPRKPSVAVFQTLTDLARDNAELRRELDQLRTGVAP